LKSEDLCVGRNMTVKFPIQYGFSYIEGSTGLSHDYQDIIKSIEEFKIPYFFIIDKNENLQCNFFTE